MNILTTLLLLAIGLLAFALLFRSIQWFENI